MQSIATLFQLQPGRSHHGSPCWFRAAAFVVLAGALSASALAQMPADSTADEKTEAASEPPTAAGHDAASQSQPEGPASWNRRRTAATGVDGQLQRLTTELKLDAAQQAKIRTILVARSEEIKRLQRDTALTLAERRQRALAIGDRSAEQIRAQLTEAQRARFVQPRATTAVAQAGATGRRGGTAAPPAKALPAKGAAQ
jgi:hypothetical protein